MILVGLTLSFSFRFRNISDTTIVLPSKIRSFIFLTFSFTFFVLTFYFTFIFRTFSFTSIFLKYSFELIFLKFSSTLIFLVHVLQFSFTLDGGCPQRKARKAMRWKMKNAFCLQIKDNSRIRIKNINDRIQFKNTDTNLDAITNGYTNR